MIKTKQLLFLAIIYSLLFGCSGKKSNEDENLVEAAVPSKKGYSMIFYSLDNYALIYVDDQLVYNSRKDADLSKRELLVNLNPYIKGSNHILKIEGYNTACNSCQVNNYEFVYEIYRDGESIEYVNEYSNHKQSPVGLSLTRKHVLSDL